MKKQLSLAVAIALGLAACGSSDSSSSPEPAPKYDWQIINLYAADQSDVAKGCIIYDNAIAEPQKVITASIALYGYNVLFHNRDGSVITKHTIKAADVPSTGIVTIDSANVPAGGYVSLEEVDGGIGGNADVYMFSVQKELLSDLVLNVRQPQMGASCYKGSQELPAEIVKSAAVSVLQEKSISHYQSSYGLDVDGHSISSHIPVKSELPAQKQVLVTAYEDDADSKASIMSHYGMIQPGYIYDSNNPGSIIARPLTNENLIYQPWSSQDNLSVDRDSAIYMVYGDNSYLWQSIFNSNHEFALVDGNSDMQHWSAYFTGVDADYDWQYHSYIALDGANSVVVNTLPAMYDFSDMGITTNCSSETSADLCIDTSSYSSGDFDLQRTQVRSTTTVGGRNFYQSIYAAPNAQQVLMNSSVVTMAPDVANRIEVGLTKSDNQPQALNYMMAESINIQTAAKDSPIVPEYTDTNGAILTISEKSAAHQAILATNSTMVSNSKN
ncbi:hypothetical protein swp_1321 [Shewanella piezotolerans WP3]|uniref:Lipoprotein n=1 Tax=Shewanella piezotolerans (strain WP3 / JCM 13877) TaxID=225849 RepID=B8CJL2_SHEPW|nr:hypothetical protein [Shewanella piezotolerans]ACJ28109.1 hypothetical protein swp_1321 [Shewanella piezotolerans WP3]